MDAKALRRMPFAQAAAIWLDKGSIYPHHYLLPARASAGDHGFNPLKPQGDWRTAWEALRVAAGLPTLRLKDLRHHAITKLLENPNISERTVIEIAGHVDATMLNTYSHQRLNAKFAAVDALSTGIKRENDRLKPLLVASSKFSP